MESDVTQKIKMSTLTYWQLFNGTESDITKKIKITIPEHWQPFIGLEGDLNKHLKSLFQLTGNYLWDWKMA
jgi:hypothetical protein